MLYTFIVSPRNPGFSEGKCNQSLDCSQHVFIGRVTTLYSPGDGGCVKEKYFRLLYTDMHYIETLDIK